MKYNEIEIGEIEDFFSEEDLDKILQDDISNISEATKIGNINLRKKAGNCFVTVGVKEGQYIPHFHISSNNGAWASCIKIYVPEYFNHGNYYTEILSNDQVDILNKWLDSTSKEGTTIWKYISDNWIRNNVMTNNNDKNLIKTLEKMTKPTYELLKDANRKSFRFE